MNDRLNQSQIDFYRENGFLVIEDFLTPGELDHWQKSTQEAVDQRLASLAAHKAGSTDGDARQAAIAQAALLVNQATEDDYYARVFIQCLKLVDTHAGMRELLLDPRLGKLAATLAEVDGIRIWHDQALFKPPFGNPTGWHLDNPFWSFSSKQAISIWIALDDATRNNGCLYYLPGTHKLGTFKPTNIGKNQADLFNMYPEWRQIDSVACPAPAGAAVFHNGLTAHGAGANMTNRPRRAMTCAYMPEGSTFNGVRNILPEDYFRSLQVGDLLNDNALNPLIWPA